MKSEALFTAPNFAGDTSRAPDHAFVGAVDARVKRIAKTIESPGSVLVLIGEPGSGKSYLAQSAAELFGSSHQPSVQRIQVETSEELSAALAGWFEASPRPLGEQSSAESAPGAAESAILILAKGIDQFSDSGAELLVRLARSRQARLLCTARRIMGAADRLLRDPAADHLTVEPLTLEETDAFLSRLLDIDNLAQDTCQRWHAATRGNQHALVTFALAAERRGAVQRANRVGWVSRKDDEFPADFVSQLGPLTEIERETIELVSIAAPMHEPALLRLLDSEAVEALLERQALVVRSGAEGMSALVTRVPATGDAVRAQLSPVRRAQLAVECFDALDADAEGLSTLSTAGRMRLVRFGLEGGCSLPVDWLWQAMRATRRSEDLPFALRVSLASMRHENPIRRAESMLRAVDLAHFLGDRDAAHEALSSIHELLGDEADAALLDPQLRSVLELAAIVFEPTYEIYPELGGAALEAWQLRRISAGQRTPCLAHSLRARFLAFGGSLRAVIETDSGLSEKHGLEDEWFHAPARTFEALVRVQRGEFRTALLHAESTRQVTLLQSLSPTFSGDLEGFTVFLVHWARGVPSLARQALRDLAVPERKDLTVVQASTGLADLAIALLALQEARWHDAAEVAGSLTAMLVSNDAFGVMPAAQAALALALAALGDSEGSSDALRHGERITPGVSRAIRGVVECLKLRALHWLRDPGIVDRAGEVIAWASAEQLPLIELEASYVVAHETAASDPELLDRAARLASGIDSPIGEAILACIRSLADGGDEAADPHWRVLAELGLWLPLPPVARLTGREREVALLTALGYPSKQVASRLHLSSRTVETHLTHVYEKLGIAGREELRTWFSRRRELI